MKWLRVFRGYAFFLVLLVAWQVFGDPDSALLPSPSTWCAAFVQIAQSGELWTATASTLTVFFEAVVVGSLLGIVIGITIGSSPLLNRIVDPLFEFFRTIPPVVLIPSAVILFGIERDMQVGMVVFAAIWPILLGTAAARRALPEQRLDVARTMQFSWHKRMLKIVVPSLLPEITVGIRVSAPISLIIVMITEYMVGSGGLGHLLFHSQQTFNAANAWALTAFIGVLGILMTRIIDASEWLLLRRSPFRGTGLNRG